MPVLSPRARRLAPRSAQFCLGPPSDVDRQRAATCMVCAGQNVPLTLRSNPLSTHTFADLGVPTSLTRVLAESGITTPTPIKAATLPDSLAGRDVLGRGRTGSGKTYAFLLPLVTRLLDGPRATARKPRALILAPTRELV